MPPLKKVAAEASRPLTERQLAARDLEVTRSRVRAEAGKRVDFYIAQIAEAAHLIVSDPRLARIRFEEIYQEMKVERTEDNPKKRAEALTATENARVEYDGQVCTVLAKHMDHYAVRLRLLTDTGEIITKVDPLRVRWISSIANPAPDPLPMPEKKKKTATPPDAAAPQLPPQAE